MERRSTSYDEGAQPEPFHAGEPDYEDGPIALGDGEPSGSGRKIRLIVVDREAAPGAHEPPEVGGMSPSSAPLSSALPTSPLRSVWGFAKGVAGLVGVFLAVLALEVLGLLLGAVVVGLLADGGPFALSDDAQLMLSDIIIQLTWLAAVVPWWLGVRKRGIGLDRPRRGRGATAGGESPAVQRVLAVVLLGVGLQVVISILLALILPLFPEVMESYDSMMDDSGATSFTVLGVLSVAVLAPVVEETTFRGIAFQYALCAVCPAWSADLGAKARGRLRVRPARFWAANVLQALAFGIMHLNIVQGVYAFAIGLVCGWVFWRTGELRWSMGLHAALNFCSYFVSEILDVMSLFGLFELGQFVFPILFVYWGVRLFERGSADTALA